MNLPGYIIRRRLGAGGQAVVYLATQRSLDRPVALKVLHPRFAESDEFTARFLNEGRIVANLDHGNVITIHDIGVAGELHFLSMELVEGGDLKRRIRSGIHPETILDHLIDIADCLTVVHDKHIVHRDIKPENVLFRRDGTLVLTDFGIAKHLQLSNELTMSGTTLGSPNYLSPEQAKGRPLDGRADLYSLGAMAYEMFTGARPYASGSEFDTVFMHVNAPLPRLPEEFALYQPIIDCTMAKSPDDRISNADQLGELLHSLRNASAAVEPTLLPTTSFTAVGEMNRRNPRLTPPPIARTTRLPAITAPELTRTEGTRLPLIMVAVLSLFLIAAWLSEPVGDSIDSAAVAPTFTLPAVPVTTSAVSPGRDILDPRIDDLLGKAESALADFRLTRPRDDNALHYFREVLAIDSDNTRALKGPRRISERYAILATRAFEKRDLDKASTMVSRGMRTDPGNIDLRTLQAKLRQSRVGPLVKVATRPPSTHVATIASRLPPTQDESTREILN